MARRAATKIDVMLTGGRHLAVKQWSVAMARRAATKIDGMLTMELQ
jgi:hypothetical protein